MVAFKPAWREQTGWSKHELIYGVISFARHKTEIGVELGMNKELAELWQWFIKMKKNEQIISPCLLVNPRYFDMRSRGRPTTHKTLQTAWWEAGYSGLYHLSDLRKKGRTEEYVTQGESDKGGHKTQAMAGHYRLIKPPKRVRSTITFLLEEANQNESVGQSRVDFGHRIKRVIFSVYSQYIWQLIQYA